MHRITILEIRGMGYYLVEKDEYGNFIDENFLDYNVFFDKWKKRIEAQDNVVDFSINENILHIAVVDFHDFSFEEEEYELIPSKNLLNPQEILGQFKKLGDKFKVVKEQTLENISLKKQSYFDVKAIKYISEGILSKYVSDKDYGKIRPEIRDKVISYFETNKNSLCWTYFKTIINAVKPFLFGASATILFICGGLLSTGISLSFVLGLGFVLSSGIGAILYNDANKRKNMAEELVYHLKDEATKQNYRNSALENFDFSNMLCNTLKLDREYLKNISGCEDIEREFALLEKTLTSGEPGSNCFSKKDLLNTLSNIEIRMFSKVKELKFISPKSLHITKRMIIERLNFLGFDEVKNSYQMKSFFHVVDRIYKLPYMGAEVELSRLIIIATEYLETRQSKKSDMTFLAGIYDVEKEVTRKINSIIESEDEGTIRRVEPQLEIGKKLSL